MTQTEKRIYLIKYLLNEQPQYKNAPVPLDKQKQKVMLRSLFNTRMPKPVSEDFLQIQNEYLEEEINRKGITEIADLQPARDNLYLWQGDITNLRCDAIVNAANSQMLGCFCPCHGCIDNAIAFCAAFNAGESRVSITFLAAAKAFPDKLPSANDFS